MACEQDVDFLRTRGWLELYRTTAGIVLFVNLERPELAVRLNSGDDQHVALRYDGQSIETGASLKRMIAQDPKLERLLDGTLPVRTYLEWKRVNEQSLGVPD